MQNVELPQNLAQALHDYLMSRPMAEVEQLVMALRRTKPAYSEGGQPKQSTE